MEYINFTDIDDLSILQTTYFGELHKVVKVLGVQNGLLDDGQHEQDLRLLRTELAADADELVPEHL